MINLREMLIRASRKHLEAHVDKHIANLEVLFSNPAGIGEHGDIMSEIEKELEEVARYDDMLSALDNYFDE